MPKFCNSNRKANTTTAKVYPPPILQIISVLFAQSAVSFGKPLYKASSLVRSFVSSGADL